MTRGLLEKCRLSVYPDSGAINRKVNRWNSCRSRGDEKIPAWELDAKPVWKQNTGSVDKLVDSLPVTVRDADRDLQTDRLPYF
jgi:hypothetical protein